MERDIFVIIDSSGGFNECGKQYLQWYLVDSIVNAISSGTLPADNKYTFLLWNNTITEYHLYDPIRFQGRSDINVLFDFLLSLNEQSIVFVLSDGIFSEDIDALFHELKINGVTIVPFAVGADSDIINLEYISTSLKAYKPDNLISTIRRILLESIR